MRHPAKYSEGILDLLIKKVPPGLVLDPMAGVGNIHRLGPQRETFGIEIEPEWANLHPRTICGDALALPFADNTFDSIVVSPTYGNRTADSHKARDDSTRHTYTHYLGRKLAPTNSGQLQWGSSYRSFHLAAWEESARVLKPEGQFWLNVSDHIRNKKVQHVSDWHVYALEFLGFRLKKRFTVETKRLRHGQNYDQRVDHENIFVLSRY